MAKLEQRVEDFMADTLAGIREDLQDCAAAVKTLRTEHASQLGALRTEIAEERKQLEKKERSQARERVLDRRWMIGTGLVVAGLVISAMALLLNSGAG